MAMNPTIGNRMKRFSDRLRRAVRRTEFGVEWLEVLARIGFGTRGLTFVFLGGLAIVAALSERSPPSLSGAFSLIGRPPGGWIFLLAVALGLLAYGVWRLIEALLNLRGFGWDAKGLFKRTGSVLEAISYAGLGLMAAIISLDRNSGVTGEITEEAAIVAVWTERILGWPLGHWLIGAIGLAAIVAGCGQLLKARRIAFDDIAASERAMIVIRLIGRIGFAAKGVIFAATGILFLAAAWRVEFATVGGMRAALATLAAVPLGDSILFAVSIGVTLYGVFSLIKAWLHKPVRP